MGLLGEALLTCPRKDQLSYYLSVHIDDTHTIQAVDSSWSQLHPRDTLHCMCIHMCVSGHGEAVDSEVAMMGRNLWDWLGPLSQMKLRPRSPLKMAGWSFPLDTTDSSCPDCCQAS